MYYGFDIGGSKIALGVFNQERRLQWEKRVATPKSSYEDFPCGRGAGPRGR